jgi:hypothetical protein
MNDGAREAESNPSTILDLVALERQRAWSRRETFWSGFTSLGVRLAGGRRHPRVIYALANHRDEVESGARPLFRSVHQGSSRTRCRGSTHTARGRRATSAARPAPSRSCSERPLTYGSTLISTPSFWMARGARGGARLRGARRLGTSEVGDVLDRTIRRIEKHLRRRGRLPLNENEAVQAIPRPASTLPRLGPVAAGRTPMADTPRPPSPKPSPTTSRSVPRRTASSCTATRAGARDAPGREALLRDVLRPPSRRTRSSTVERAWSASS